MRFNIDGKPDDYALHFLIKGHQTDWELTGHGDQHALEVHTPKNLFLNGTLDSTVKINLNSTVQWQAQIVAKKINLSLLDAQWENNFSMDMKSSGDNANHLTMSNEVNMQSSLGQLHITAVLNNTWDIAWHLKLNTLTEFNADLNGNLESRGKINGDLLNPEFHIQANGQLLSNTKPMKQASFSLDGNFLKHTLLAKVDLNREKMNLALTGSLNNKNEWRGSLNQLNILITHSSNWSLSKPSQIAATKDAVTFSPICLTSPAAGNLCLQANFANQKFTGSLVVHSREFEWVHELLSSVRISGSQLNADFQISGTLKKPNISGSMQLNQGSVLIRKLNIILNQITISIVGDGPILKVKLQAFSQHQPINLDGTIDLSKPDFTAQATITSDHTLILNTDEYIAYATAKLTATIKNKNIIFGGTIDIPKARIETGDVQATITLPDNDIVYVGTDIHPPKPFWLVQTDLIINFGNDILMNASGVKAQLGGSIRLQQQPTRDMFSTGKIFALKGTYTIYGRILTITPDSYLEFSNSLLNDPTLNMKATQVISSVNNMGISGFSETNLIVGVNVTGSVKAPKITFISNRGSL